MLRFNVRRQLKRCDGWLFFGPRWQCQRHQQQKGTHERLVHQRLHRIRKLTQAAATSTKQSVISL